MAKYIPNLTGPIVGSMGSITFSKNRFGYYIKMKAQPTNPSTPAQAKVRGFMSTAVQNWATLLTKDEAEAWNHAAGLHKRAKYGFGYSLTGQNLYIAHFVQMSKAGIPPITEPTVFNGACDNVLPKIAEIGASGQMEITEWDQTEVNLSILVQATNCVPQTTSYRNRPFKAYHVWNTLTAWPQPISVVYPGAGEKYRSFIQISALDQRGAICSKIAYSFDGEMV